MVLQADRSSAVSDVLLSLVESTRNHTWTVTVMRVFETGTRGEWLNKSIEAERVIFIFETLVKATYFTELGKQAMPLVV